MIRRVNLIQEQVAGIKQNTEDALVDAINAIKVAAADLNAAPPKTALAFTTLNMRSAFWLNQRTLPARHKCSLHNL